jgi:amidase
VTAAEALRSSAARQAALVRSGELSARELVEASLAANERLDPAINAFVLVCPERALAEANTVRPGDERPLCGVPIAVKDLLGASEGLPTAHGSAAFGDWVAGHDTAHVRRLREAGAIVVGKTNTPELGLRPVTESARFGITRNPWNLELAAGGSSGGSAAAVAAGMVALAEGSDLGGSIRIPASCCGVVGLKPSRGRVSIGPDFGDIGGGTPADGPIARTTLDAALALDAMAGYEPGDHHWLGAPPRTFAEATKRPLAHVPIFLALDAPLGIPVDGEPRTAARRAATLLAELGHDVVEQSPDWNDETFPSAWSTFVTGALQHIVRVLERLHDRPVDPELAEPATRAWLLDSPPVTLLDYLEAQERLIAFSRRILRFWPPDTVLVTPTLTRLPAPADSLRSQAGVTDDAVRFSALVRPWNVTGQPAISLPLHQTDDGVPVGVQLVGPPGREDMLLALAAQLEATAGWTPHAPVPAERLKLAGTRVSSSGERDPSR